jgi:uncharacterized protein with PIN domain
MSEAPPPRFACDAMLGGLARWLRAAGYDASWHDGIDDGDLVRLGRTEGRTVLSSDDDVFAFAVVRDGIVPALFVPRGLTVQAQTTHVLRRLGLPLREPRCMVCGGELGELAKEGRPGGCRRGAWPFTTASGSASGAARSSGTARIGSRSPGGYRMQSFDGRAGRPAGRAESRERAPDGVVAAGSASLSSRPSRKQRPPCGPGIA